MSLCDDVHFGLTHKYLFVDLYYLYTVPYSLEETLDKEVNDTCMLQMNITDRYCTVLKGSVSTLRC